MQYDPSVVKNQPSDRCRKNMALLVAKEILKRAAKANQGA
ncbi:hypothetical protein PAAL109150_10025 [Paenibacillus alkaliterrae]